VLLVGFDVGRVNLLTVGERRYFLFDHEGRTRLVNDACPHRGGPLHLSVRACDALKVVCPWHETATPERRVAARNVPLVREGTRGCAVFDAPPDTPVRRRWTAGAVLGDPATRPRPRLRGVRGRAA
jgi:hypothetical protein